MDVTVQLRVPDTAQLHRDDARYQSFLDFFGHTVPKHTVYESEIGVHSGYREVLEQREEKLRSRLDYDLDITEPHADEEASLAATQTLSATRVTDDGGMTDHAPDSVAVTTVVNILAEQ